MRNAWTIAKREFNMYFVSPVAYMVMFLMLLILGWLFYANLAFTVQQGGGALEPARVISPFITLLLFCTPAITMRLIAEEQRTGTVELLFTAPVREWELVLGKWLAALGFVATIVFATVFYAIILHQYTDQGIDRGALFANYAGVLLFAGAVLAVGVFASTLFSNQIAAFFVTLAILLLLWIASIPGQNSTEAYATVLTYLEIRGHFFDNFYTGVIDLSDFVYFASVITLFLFMATRVIESRRWR